jgi:hypothetical protein
MRTLGKIGDKAARTVHERLVPKRGPALDERDDLGVAQEHDDRVARAQRVCRIRRRRSPRPIDRRPSEQAQIVEEMPREAAIADDADGHGITCRYLSHRSGPHSKTEKLDERSRSPF